MADASAIEWTDATWNPTTGCDRINIRGPGAHTSASSGARLPGFAPTVSGVSRYRRVGVVGRS